MTNETMFNSTGGAFNGSNSDRNGNGSNYNNTYSDSQEDPHVVTKLVSVYTPLLYGALVILSLLVFAKGYSRRKVQQMRALPSLFDEHDARDIYLELIGVEKVHDKVLCAALLNRGGEAVRRTLKLKEMAPQVELLYKNGSLGDDYWQRFQTEVKLIDLEFKECLQESERLQPGWAQRYVELCREICLNQALSRRYQAIAKRRTVAAQEWDLDIDENGRMK